MTRTVPFFNRITREDPHMTETPSLARSVPQKLVRLLREAVKTSCDLFKILVPIMIVTRILTDLGVVAHLGRALGPIMHVVGLPGSMGLVWATAMVTSIYGAMVVFASLFVSEPLTVAQVTVLGTMILVAHGLPIELRIAQKAGPRFRVMAPLRILGAIAVGWALARIYHATDYLQGRNEALWNPAVHDPSWRTWAVDQARNLVWIFLIILALLFLMKVLRRLGITAFLTRILEPVLRLLGMRREAAPVTIIGMTLGLSYGGGLIIQEARSGKLTPRDVFFSLALMGLCHSLIEDTLLVMVLGANLTGILLARLLFALLVVFVLVRALSNVSEERFERWFCRSVTGQRAAEPAPK